MIAIANCESLNWLVKQLRMASLLRLSQRYQTKMLHEIRSMNVFGNNCQVYNPEFGDQKLCKCGHPYYRHFDTYEDMRAVGCKYCGCHLFIDANAECKHILRQITDEEYERKTSVSMVCKICDKQFGWHCYESPDGVCHYESVEGKVELIDGKLYPLESNYDPQYENSDSCIFCKLPDERK